MLCLQGTNIAAGKCRGIVVGTGLETEIGVFSFHNYAVHIWHHAVDSFSA